MDRIIQALVAELGCRGKITHFSPSIYEADGKKFFVKTDQCFAAEAFALKCLEESCLLRVPSVYCCGEDFLILEYLELKPHTAKTMQELGENLAKLHLQCTAEKFGFDMDNTIGLTPQINTWESDWVDFFSKYRLKFQLDLTKDPEIAELGERLLGKLPAFFEGVKIFPSLLHGDLWAGNTAAVDEEAVVFDPASYYGHHEADLSIAAMFGGFTEEFHSAYHALIPKERGFDMRHELYKLYHYLNHLNLFGESYRSPCLAIFYKLLS